MRACLLLNIKDSKNIVSDSKKSIDENIIGNVVDNGDNNIVISDLVEGNANSKVSVSESEICSDNSVFPDGYVPISATKIRGAFEDDDWIPPASTEDDFIDTCSSLPVESNVTIGNLIDISNEEVIAEKDEDVSSTATSAEPEEIDIPHELIKAQTF